jgi:hypothetical protein
MNFLLTSNTENKVGGTNFNNDFVVSFPEIIDAENSTKSIRVLNVAYPKTIDNVKKEKCGIKLNFTFNVQYTQDGAEAKFTTEWLFLPPGQYSLKELISTLNRLTNEFDLFFFILNGGRVGVRFASYVSLYCPNLGAVGYQKRELPNMFNFEMTDDLTYMLGLSSFVLHPTVEKYKTDTIALGHPSSKNKTDWEWIYEYLYGSLLTHADGTVTVDRKITTFYGEYLTDITNGINTIFVYCDKVARSVVGDTNSRLLTCIHIQKDNAATGELVSYTPPPFVTRLINSKIENVHITLRDTAYNLIQFSAGTVNISCVGE